jgi:polar amino acid transport system permease protein
MFRLDAVMGDLARLLLGVPLTLGITAVAFAVGTVAAPPLALARIAGVPVRGSLAVAWLEFFRTTPPLMHVVWAYYALDLLAYRVIPAVVARRGSG